MEILKNPWVVGIVTGIISGILVFFLTKWIMDKRGKVEYFKQVNVANNNVINSLKPYIADKGLPDINIFEALIASTARTLNVDKEDMYTVSVYCEELIREIISDVYVSNDKKEQYTAMLAGYKKNIAKKEALFEFNIASQHTGSYAEKMRRQISVLISILTAVLGMVCSITLIYSHEGLSTEFWFYPFNDNPVIFIPIIIVLPILLITMIAMLSELSLKSIRKHKAKISHDNTDSKSTHQDNA